MHKLEEMERRDYFRINDRVLLHYRVIDAQAMGARSAEEQFPYSTTFDLMRQLHALEQEHGGAVRAGTEHDRELDQQFRLLHRKIDLVAGTLIALEQDRNGLLPLTVSLSEGGVAFPADVALPIGTLLALQIQLLPERIGLHLYGEVIHNQEPDDEEPRVAVGFVQLREAERQLLARHILKSQINARRQRQQQD